MSHLMGRLMLMCICALTFSAWSATSAAACSCDSFTDDEAFAHADAVFVGRLAAIQRKPSGPTIYHFETSEVYRGEVTERQPVVSGGGCDMSVDESKPVLVFARTTDGIPGRQPGQLDSSLCSGNRSVAGPSDVPASFGAAGAPEPGGPVPGASDGGADPLVLVVASGAVCAVLGYGLYRRRAASR